ncbi:hypothetical protein [Saliterribacillus persicus]|nr:hypothetical protein [Saliterribacillus persicus]
MAAVKDHFGFEHPSDNVVDAYIMSQIALSAKKGNVQCSYQVDVLTKEN